MSLLKHLNPVIMPHHSKVLKGCRHPLVVSDILEHKVNKLSFQPTRLEKLEVISNRALKCLTSLNDVFHKAWS